MDPDDQKVPRFHQLQVEGLKDYLSFQTVFRESERRNIASQELRGFCQGIEYMITLLQAGVD